MSTLAVHCQRVDHAVRERPGQLPSYTAAKENEAATTSYKWLLPGFSFMGLFFVKLRY